MSTTQELLHAIGYTLQEHSVNATDIRHLGINLEAKQLTVIFHDLSKIVTPLLAEPPRSNRKTAARN